MIHITSHNTFYNFAIDTKLILALINPNTEGARLAIIFNYHLCFMLYFVSDKGDISKKETVFIMLVVNIMCKQIVKYFYAMCVVKVD